MPSAVSRYRLIVFVLLVAAVVPYFIDLNGSSIWDANEAYYVETPREMMQRGDYISPTFNHEPRFNKPVLSYWVVAAFYKVFGVSVGVQRLPIAIGAVVLILTAFFLARAAQPPHARGAATWAALGLAVAPRLLMFSRRIFIDISISMFMGLTLLFFALAERYPERRRLYLPLMYGAAGLGVLTKGPVALALPGLVFGAYLLLHGELKRVRGMLLPAGIVIVLAIVVPWYAALYHQYGWMYIRSFLLDENVARYAAGVGVQVSRPPWYYLPVLLSDPFPWSLCLFGGAAAWFADRRQARLAPRDAPAEERSTEHRAFRVRTLLWLWVGVIVVFFSLSAAKQDLYVFPVVPAVAALGGLFIAGAGGPAPARALGWTTLAMGLVLAIAGAGVLYVFETAGKIYALDGAAFVGMVGAAGGLSTLILVLLRKPRAALVAVVLSLVVVNWTFVLSVLPSFERYKPVPALSEVIRQRVAPDDVVAHYRVALPSMVFYLGRHIEVMLDRDEFLRTIEGSRTVYAVLSAADYADLGAAAAGTCVLARRPTVNVKLNAVLARKPLPEVLLITNRCQ
ncbi:MAG: hypothetical protein A3H96_22710 [Acidobacteria bacterium RIFCSPLOWO2_02_FULL_67_36]|nr:MAG: hypothetical protein A3H96_22710 [Acidobacteria bacterium RIFCSPLOWO2_02_FULL_67_36]OFW20949.1 MAG: hypothetical protein A3G21_23470 [Acidobacteria bacterium RIFCSPLOWO2_12_FULL_66_21]